MINPPVFYTTPSKAPTSVKAKEIVFFSQSGIVILILFFSLGNISANVGNVDRVRNWATLLGTSLGYLVPRPTIEMDEGNEWKIGRCRINSKLAMYSIKLLAMYSLVITGLINLTLPDRILNEEISWIWSGFLGTCLGYLSHRPIS
jgi:hypothetical protein